MPLCSQNLLDNNEKKEVSHQKIHTRKLFNLEINQGYEKLKPDEVIRNLSGQELTEIQEDTLSKGLKFAFQPSKLN